MIKRLKNKFMEVKDFNNNKAFVQTFDGKCYCINKKGEIFFECQPFSKHYYSSSSYTYDKWNQVIIDTDIEKTACSSVLNLDGNTIIPFEPNRKIERCAKGYKFIYKASDSDFENTAIYADNNGTPVDTLPIFSGGYLGNNLVYGQIESEATGLHSIDKHKYIIKPQYDYIHPLDNIINVEHADDLLLVSKDGRYGIIDYDNNIIIPIEYDNNIYKMGDYLIVSRNNKEGLITFENKIVYDIKYDSILYCYDNCIWCCEDNTWKIVYKDGNEEILPYDDCQFPCQNTYPIIKSFDYTKYICVKKNGKWGIVDYQKKEILPIIFDEIFEYKECNLIEVKLNNKDGLYNFKGQQVIPCKYQNGFFNVNNDNKYIMANDYEKDISHYYYIQGNLLLKQEYNVLSHNVSDDVIAIFNGKYYKFITLDGKDLF